MKTQRISDPIHNLIVFDAKDDTDMLAWELLNTREFQRLRRIKQLGFSELVFPSATHTRYSHCIGVYHNAKKLIGIVQRKLGTLDPSKARVALIAALLHDLGHGAFSHTFEGVEKMRGIKKKHEKWTQEIIEGDTEIQNVLSRNDPSLAKAIGQVLTRRDPQSIYDSIVSSQFDADRLDYLPRDRYMAGIGSGMFDTYWLLDCLDVGLVTVGVDEEKDYQEVQSFYLSEKGLHAAESYILARYHLYAQVYLHKTTRSAERMLAAALSRLSALIKDGKVEEAGLQKAHRLVRYFEQTTPTVADYLRLDDVTVWSAISEMAESKDKSLAELCQRLVSRRLYKGFDVGTLVNARGGDSLNRFLKRMRERYAKQLGTIILEDQAKLSAYGIYDYDDRGALQKVLVARGGHGGSPGDIASISEIVAAIKPKQIYRVYAPEAPMLRDFDALWKEANP
jgi:uncharacterized protein